MGDDVTLHVSSATCFLRLLDQGDRPPLQSGLVVSQRNSHFDFQRMTTRIEPCSETARRHIPIGFLQGKGILWSVRK
jgi:hypothetical protein